jgi:fucose permease
MTRPVPVSEPGGAARARERALRAGLIAGLAYGLIGWRGLLVPTLIRLVAPAFGQGDAGMGLYFLATALAYGVGSMSGGRVIRVLGARRVLPAALLLMAAALAVQAATGAWAVFLAAGMLVSVGASTADVGINALVLDLFPASRGRALNLVHVSYSVGALAAPLVIAALLAARVPWPWLLLGTGVGTLLAAAGLALTAPGHPVELPAPRDTAGDGSGPGASASAARLPAFLLVMAVGAMGYVAAEAGVSDWLVRYLAALLQAQAGLALTLFWAGIAVARLAFARVGNRLDPQASAAALAAAGGALLLAALLLPVSDASPLLFGLVGLAFGPIFPLVVAATGARMPGRSATVSGTLVTAAVVGAVIVPPAIGFLSDAIGLRTAMLVTVAAAFGCAAAVGAARRVRA